MARQTKVLFLTLKKQWFDMIEAGIKREEYREIKQHWNERLVKDGKFVQYTHVLFKNGYMEDSPALLVKVRGIKIGKAVPAWSGNAQGNFYVIELGDIIV
jgi:hypothetical protein